MKSEKRSMSARPFESVGSSTPVSWSCTPNALSVTAQVLTSCWLSGFVMPISFR